MNTAWSWRRYLCRCGTSASAMLLFRYSRHRNRLTPSILPSRPDIIILSLRHISSPWKSYWFSFVQSDNCFTIKEITMPSWIFFFNFLYSRIGCPQVGESNLMGPKKSVDVKFFTVAFFGLCPTLLIKLGTHFCRSISAHHHIRPAITFIVSYICSEHSRGS